MSECRYEQWVHENVEADFAEGKRVWIWKNGDHFVVYHHEYPCMSPGGDPLTLGEPVGWGWLLPSHDRKRAGRS